MMSYRKTWNKDNLDDPAMLNCILSHSSGDYNLSFKRGDPMESLRYRMAAIKIVNERLSDPEEAIQNSTICVVAAISVYEVSRHYITELQIRHSNADDMESIGRPIMEQG